MRNSFAHVLLVDDDPDDLEFMSAALRAEGVAVTLAADGEEALARLKRRGAFDGEVRPGLVLLDLKLPRKHGLEVLKEIRSDPALAELTVVVLTGADSELEAKVARASGADAFVPKPAGLDDVRALARAIKGFWLRFCILA